MSKKLIAALIASFFVTGAFAQDAAPGSAMKEDPAAMKHEDKKMHKKHKKEHKEHKKEHEMKKDEMKDGAKQ